MTPISTTESIAYCLASLPREISGHSRIKYNEMPLRSTVTAIITASDNRGMFPLLVVAQENERLED